MDVSQVYGDYKQNRVGVTWGISALIVAHQLQLSPKPSIVVVMSSTPVGIGVGT